jgi:hypothetical protein
MAEERPGSGKVYWQFRNRNEAQIVRTAHFEGKSYTLGWDAKGHPTFYEIREDESEYHDATSLNLEAESNFVPTAFSGIHAMPWKEGVVREKQLDEVLLVSVFESPISKEEIPVAEVLYHIASERATHASTPNYSLLMLLEQEVHVMIFNSGKLAYYQQHHAENEHAVLYFLVAALRDTGIAVEDAVCELLLNNPDDFKAYRNFTSYFRFFGAFSYDGIRALVGESLPPDPLLLYLLAKTPVCVS